MLPRGYGVSGSGWTYCSRLGSERRHLAVKEHVKNPIQRLSIKCATDSHHIYIDGIVPGCPPLPSSSPPPKQNCWPSLYISSMPQPAGPSIISRHIPPSRPVPSLLQPLIAAPAGPACCHLINHPYAATRVPAAPHARVTGLRPQPAAAAAGPAAAAAAAPVAAAVAAAVAVAAGRRCS